MASKQNNEQLHHFKAAARELGAHEDEATFKAKLGVIARQKVRGKVLEPDSKPDE